MKLLVILMMSLIYVLDVEAGNEVGNGGDAVVCSNGSHRLLDYVEMESHGFELPNTELPQDYKEIVQDFLKTFAKTDPKLAEQYKLRFQKMDKQIDFKKGIELTDIKDSKHESLPKDCKLVQLAIRRKATFGGLKNDFIINQDVWEKLRPLDQAGLILHEIIYEHFYHLGEKDSSKARYMNGLIAHLAGNNPLKVKYREMLQKMELPIYR